MKESTKDKKAMGKFKTVAEQVNDGNYTGLDDCKITIAGNDYYCNVIMCEDSNVCRVCQDVGNFTGLFIGEFNL